MLSARMSKSLGVRSFLPIDASMDSRRRTMAVGESMGNMTLGQGTVTLRSHRRGLRVVRGPRLSSCHAG